MVDFFEFSNEMLCLANRDGYFLRVNQAWSDALGWSSEELTSRPYFDFVHPDDLADTQREAECLRNDRYETVLFENRYRCSDGSYRWLSWRVVPLPETDQLVCSAHDITHQKQQTEALRELEQRFRTLANHAPVGIAQADATGSIFYVNQKWCELAGVALGEAIGYTWKDYIHPDDREHEIVRWQTALSKGIDIPPHEFRFLHTNGTIRWGSSSVAMIKNEQGEVIGQIAAVVDITDQKSAELALREAEERFRAFMTNSPTIAWAKDDSGRLVFLNKTCEDRFNLTRKDWRNKTNFEFWPSETAARLQANERQVLRGGQPIQSLEETPGANGLLNHWMTILFPYQDGVGNRYVGGVAVDVSELKRTEEALQVKQDLMRSLIEVQENEKQTLCHEFHDGLIQYAVGALMSLEAFKREQTPDHETTKIDEAISNLRKGIDDGRRAIRGIRTAVLDDSDLHAAIQDLIEQFASSGIVATCYCDPEIGRLPERIQTTIYRVVQEALNNARKHSGTEVVRIELTQADGQLRLDVCDFGRGFVESEATSRGFGLLGMNERVRMLGGHCQVHSEPGAGTRISVRLPLPNPQTSGV